MACQRRPRGDAAANPAKWHGNATAVRAAENGDKNPATLLDGARTWPDAGSGFAPWGGGEPDSNGAVTPVRKLHDDSTNAARERSVYSRCVLMDYCTLYPRFVDENNMQYCFPTATQNTFHNGYGHPPPLTHDLYPSSNRICNGRSMTCPPTPCPPYRHALPSFPETACQTRQGSAPEGALPCHAIPERRLAAPRTKAPRSASRSAGPGPAPRIPRCGRHGCRLCAPRR